MEAKEAKEAKKSKGEGKKQSQADSLSASVSASAGSKTSSASGTPRTGVNDGGGGGGSKVTSAAETAKPTEPRQKLTFPDPVPVKASVWLRNSPQSATSKLTVDLQGQCIRQGDEVKFSLDTILSAEQSTEDVYQDSLYPLVQATFDGFDTCLFAFAQDGPTADKILHSESDGMLVQLFEDVFRMVKVNSGDGRQFLVELSYVLVGADKIYDLLCTKATKMGKAMMLKPSELDSGALMPESCVREAATSEDVLMDTYHRGKNFIHQLYETKPELRDLGSQSVLTISVECNEPVNGKDVFTKGSVRLVDCRASEINASQNLVALRSVIDAVGKKSKRVLWNASALPNMLRDAVGGGTLTRFLGVGDIPSLLGSSCFELLNAARRVMTRPVLKERLDMQLKKVKEEIEALKAKFKNTKAEAERARRLELEHEASTKKSALQQRLEQRKLQLQRNKEREDAEKARQAKLEEMRKNGTLKEPTIKYKIIEKEVVVEKEVEKEIIEKIVIGQRDEDIAEQKRLRQGATMTLEERNRLAMDAQQRDKEIAEAERKRAEAEQQFKALQMKVIGLASGSLIGEHEDGTVLDPTVIIARQQEQLRKAEYELKEQKKKEAKLRALQKRMKGAQDKVAQQIKAAKAEAEAHQKSQSAAKFKGKAALEEANRAIRKQRETQLAASKGLVEKHEKSVSDALLMETLVMQFLTRGELDQLRAISAGDEYGSFFEVPQLVTCEYDYDDRLAGIDDHEPSWAERSIGAAAASPARSTSSKLAEAAKKDKKAVDDMEKSIKKYKKIAGKLSGEFKSIKKKVVDKTADALQHMDTAKAVELLKSGVDRLTGVLKNVGYSNAGSSSSKKKSSSSSKSSSSKKSDKKKRSKSSSSSTSKKEVVALSDDGVDPWDSLDLSGGGAGRKARSLNDEERDVFEELLAGTM